MYLSCQKAFLLSLFVIPACSDSAGPALKSRGAPLGLRYSRVYALESVDGQAIPAIHDMGQFGSTTYVRGTFTLDTAGNAVTITHLRDEYPTGSPRESDLSIPGYYLVRGDSIEVGGFGKCPPGAMCAPNRIGVFSDTVSTLTWAILPPTDPVFRYRLVQGN
jgi:hypothetical protein